MLIKQEKIKNDFVRYGQIVDYFVENPERLTEENKDYLRGVRGSLWKIGKMKELGLTEKVSILKDKLDSWIGDELILIFEEEGKQKALVDVDGGLN